MGGLGQGRAPFKMTQCPSDLYHTVYTELIDDEFVCWLRLCVPSLGSIEYGVREYTPYTECEYSNPLVPRSTPYCLGFFGLVRTGEMEKTLFANFPSRSISMQLSLVRGFAFRAGGTDGTRKVETGAC